MGIFFNDNSEERNYNPSLNDSDAMFSAFPSHIISSANLSWSEYRALRNSSIFTAVTTIAKDMARLDIKLKENGVMKNKNTLENLLNNRPNDIYNGYQLRFSVMLAALLTGVGYILIKRANGQPVALYHIPTSSIQMKQDDKGNYYYEIENNGETEEVDYKDIISIKPFVEDGLNTLSILDSLKDDLDSQTYSKKFFANAFKNGVQAGSLLKMKNGKLSKEARNKIKDEWQAANSGEDNAGKVLVLDETMEFEQLEINQDILKLIIDNKSTPVSIAAAFSIPPHKLGLESPNTSMQSQIDDYLHNTLSSYMRVWTAELNFKLLTVKDDYKKVFVFDDTSYRQVNWAAYIETLNTQLDKGAITLNEYREAIGKEPVEGGDIVRVDLNHISIELADDFQLRDVGSQGNNQATKSVDEEAQKPSNKGGVIDDE